MCSLRRSPLRAQTRSTLAFSVQIPKQYLRPITFLNNYVFEVGSPQDGGCPTGAGALSVDPAFRNPLVGDCHEQDSSPLTANGDISAPLIPPADLDEKARTVCGTIDIGAYELRPHPPITLNISANSAPGGSSPTFTAKLTGNCNVPAGTVTFLDAGVPLETAAVDGSGMAALSTSYFRRGSACSFTL